MLLLWAQKINKNIFFTLNSCVRLNVIISKYLNGSTQAKISGKIYRIKNKN